jgi:tRNA modification GTPase
MHQNTSAQNRAVVLTPPGVGAIAVVRILGPKTDEFLLQHFSKRAQPLRCVHGLLIDGERQIDDPVVVWHSDGRAADLNLHGGTWAVRAALELAARSGFEIVESGESEISPEGIDSDDEIEREALAHLPRALTELGVRALLSQPSAWRKLNRELYAMDFAQKRQMTEQILQDRSLWRLLNPPRVAIVGAANVGKSTLANQLFAQERSITADIPGTTRDWVGEFANVDGLPIMLLDTPGIRQTPDLIEQQAIRQSGQEIAQADLVILVLDSSRSLEPDQSPLLESHRAAFVVLNKSDHAAERSRRIDGAIRIVATTGEGIDALRQRISLHFGCEELDCDRACWWTERQRAALESMSIQPE